MSPSTPTLRLIEGGHSAEHEWTEAEIRRLTMPSVKALPFVKLKEDAEPQWHPESHWQVTQSRTWEESYDRGRR